MNRVRNAPRIEKIKLPVSFEGAKENVTGEIKKHWYDGFIFGH